MKRQLRQWSSALRTYDNVKLSLGNTPFAHLHGRYAALQKKKTGNVVVAFELKIVVAHCGGGDRDNGKFGVRHFRHILEDLQHIF